MSLRQSAIAREPSPVMILTVGLLVSLILLAAIISLVWKTDHDVRVVLVSDLRVLDTLQRVEDAPSISQLVRAIVSSNDYDQRRHYDEEVQNLDELISSIIQVSSDAEIRRIAADWLQAHRNIMAVEKQAMQLGEDGKAAEGLQLLLSDRYYEPIDRYDRFEVIITDKARDRHQKSQAIIEQRTFIVFLLVLIIFLLFTAIWVVAVLSLRRYLKDRQQLLDKMSIMLEHDSLTNLYNRRGFMNAARTIWANDPVQNSHAAILYVDLDNLKIVNDTYGHETGDKMLVGASNMLRVAFPEPIVVARLGGDEFAIIQIVDSLDEGYKLEMRLQKTLEAYNKTSKLEVEISLSVGCFVFNPESLTLNQALSEADHLMYKNKKTRKTQTSA
jgi:diguanylate cyclase (GGDEF)-like protein